MQSRNRGLHPEMYGKGGRVRLKLCKTEGMAQDCADETH